MSKIKWNFYCKIIYPIEIFKNRLFNALGSNWYLGSKIKPFLYYFLKKNYWGCISWLSWNTLIRKFYCTLRGYKGETYVK